MTLEIESKRAKARDALTKYVHTEQNFAPDVEVGSELGFSVDDESLLYCKNNEKPRPVSSYLRLKARTKDVQGTSWGVQIEYKNYDHQLIETVLDCRRVANVSEFRNWLSDVGVRLSHPRKSIEQLQDYLLRSHVAERLTLVAQTGWFENRCFVMRHRTIGSESVRFKEGHPQTGYSCGSLESWQKDVSVPAVGNPFIQFAISLGFAGSILSLVHSSSFVVHYFCQSSRGKTITANVVSSVWGGPATMGSWHGTRNALEAQLSENNGTCLVNDEIGQAPANSLQEIIYMTGNEREKGRANIDGRTRESARHSLTIFSTGEKPVTEINAPGKDWAAGAQVRVLCIPVGTGLFVETRGEEPASFANSIKLAAQKNFGVAGPIFVERILDEFRTSFDRLAERLSSLVNELLRSSGFDLAALDGQIQRVATSFATVALAGELATEFGITGWDTGDAMRSVQHCFTAWMTHRGTAGALEDLKIKSHIRRILEEFGESYFQPIVFDSTGGTSAKSDRFFGRLYGYTKETESGRIWLISPQIFMDEFCKGFDHKQVIDVLKKCQWLNLDNEGKSTRQHRIPNGSKPRFYELNAGVFDD